MSETRIGMSENQNTTNHTSLATQITRERLGMMQGELKKEIGLKTQNIMDTDGVINGFRINLTLPTKLILT